MTLVYIFTVDVYRNLESDLNNRYFWYRFTEISQPLCIYDTKREMKQKLFSIIKMAFTDKDVQIFNDTLQAMYQEEDNSHTNQIIVKTMVVVTFFLVNIGNGMLLGVIHFEKYGQDPMKRSFPDRMFANSCWLHVYISFANNLIEEYRALIGRFSLEISTYYILHVSAFILSQLTNKGQVYEFLYLASSGMY